MPPPNRANSNSEHPSQFHAQRSTGPGFQGQAPGPSHQYYHEPLPSKLLEQGKLFLVQLACAGGSGALAKTAVAPLERVKILLQVQGQSTLPVEQRYHGIMDALRRIPAREGGFRALYRGNGANVVRLVPDIGFKFIVHDQFKIMFTPADGSALGVLERFAAGAATGMVRTMIFYPLDIARTRITADTSPPGPHRNYPGIQACLSKTFRQEGFRGLYKGFVLSNLGIIPYLSISLSMYDWLKGTSMRYKSALDCVRTMLREEGGVASLYKGARISILKTIPGAAIQFVAYDLIKTTVAMVDPTTGITPPI
ncbi:mitochondrial carrier [Dunaliella salina]|uniref:Mitochondrial carrier n=1 Tax=Dunaliella salina TaxID=3046 RepID=A0ABQ7GL80_DUNSA|nr:mitochondrial carrier [Dunaliella salina]|eukprot:KAF5835356.1 mitochondrial carrier [Dunaliella salina]